MDLLGSILNSMDAPPSTENKKAKGTCSFVDFRYSQRNLPELVMKYKFLTYLFSANGIWINVFVIFIFSHL